MHTHNMYSCDLVSEKNTSIADLKEHSRYRGAGINALLRRSTIIQLQLLNALRNVVRFEWSRRRGHSLPVAPTPVLVLGGQRPLHPPGPRVSVRSQPAARVPSIPHRADGVRGSTAPPMLWRRFTDG